MTEYIRKEPLKGDDAINLWLHGKDEWNEKIDQYSRVDFTGVEFNKIDTTKKDFKEYSDKVLNHRISFNGFKFPNGGVDFRFATFGHGSVSFFRTIFRDGDVDFADARFGNRNINFSFIKSGRGDVNFMGATFGKGDVSFNDAAFGNGSVNFRFATFGDGDVSFRRARFGNGNVLFDIVKFGDGDVNFRHATIGIGNVSFNDAAFGKGDVNFMGATFGKGDVSFKSAAFGKGDVLFKGAAFDYGNVVFDCAKCDGLFDFRPQNTSQVKRLSFFACTFKGVMLLEGKFSCTPDLRSTYLATNLDLENLTIEYKRLTEKELRQDAIKLAKKQWIKDQLGEWENNLPEKTTDDKKEIKRQELNEQLNNELTPEIIKYWIEKGINPKPENSEFELVKEIRKTAVKEFDFLVFRQDKETPAYFRRLKELAEKNRDHNKALDFFAEECSADRENQKRARVWLDKAYAHFCSHGRSIKQPLGWLVGSWLVFSWVYASVLPWFNYGMCSEYSHVHGYEDPKFWDAFLLNIFNSVPFLGFTRHGYNNIFSKIFGSDPSWGVYAWIGAQSLTAFIFLFLIGLGIRNRFRI